MSLKECCWLTEQIDRGRTAPSQRQLLTVFRYINFCPLFSATFSSNSFQCKNLFSLPTLVSECFSSEVQLMIFRCHSYKTITEVQLTISFGMNSGFVCA